MGDKIKAVFLAALETSIDQRPEYLDQACGGDTEVRRRVEALLRAHEGTDPLLDRPAWRPPPEPDGPPAPAGGPPERAGRVHLLGEIARGGMGTVLRGHDPELGRELAVKVILPAHRDNPDLVRRFVAEARLAGQLQHPGIMPVYDLGHLADGRPFFTMKLIQGRTLAELLAERAEPVHDLPRFLRYFEAVCQAVGYAHAHGVIHRDLKPQNVMVGAFGEVQVMDWGLAKQLEERFEPGPDQTSGAPGFPSSTPLPAALTRPGAVVGTPGYLAPEQARGQAGGQQSDVFGLGAILCEVLTGAPPFRRAGLLDLLEQARAGDLSDATDRLDCCGADPELVRLAKDCLGAEPAGRPADGSVVAARLADHLAAVQERLRRAEMGQARAEARAEGERTRRRLAVGLAAAFLAVVALGSGTLVLVERQEADQAREQARRQQAAESALVRAADFQGQGRWAEALAVLQQARQRLDERDEQVRRKIQRAVVELELVGRLEKVRLRAATWVDRTFASARADREYELEFRAAGLGGPDEPAETTAERVRASGVRAALVAALDAWAVITDHRQRRDWARAVARSADQGSAWGRRLRASWADPAALGVLAHEAPVDRLSPHLLVALALALGNSREAVPFLRKAQAQYPGDFWLTFSLANRLFEERRHAEAAGFYRAALAARPDTPAVLVNLGIVLKARNQLDEACDCFRRAIVVDPENVYAHYDLAIALVDKGQVDAAILSYRKAIKIRPKYALAHTNLGNALMVKGQVDAAILSYRKAIKIDPKLALAYSGLGNALKAKGQGDAAIVCFRKAIRINPNYAEVHTNLGAALKAKGQGDAAIVCFRKAIEINPKLAQPHYNLALALYDKKDLEGAIASYRKAISLDPKHAQAHANLGAALQAKGQLVAAIASYQKAIALAPKLFQAQNNLGTAWVAVKELDRAADCFRKAIEIDPRNAQVHCNLGHALTDQSKLDEAEAEFRCAIALEPKGAVAHYNLGYVLQIKGQLGASESAYRRALALDPKFAEAHCNLGLVLRLTGRLQESLDCLRRGHRLGMAQPGWSNPSPRWVKEAERLAELDRQLPAFVRGERKLRSADECLELVSVCRLKRCHAAAARFSAEAFAFRPKLAEDLFSGRRYHAACFAALASCGRGEDAVHLNDQAKARLRGQSLAWLRADLAAWRTHKEGSQRTQALGHWQADQALAVVRDKEELAKLPQAERAAWVELWAEVEKLVKQRS